MELSATKGGGIVIGANTSNILVDPGGVGESGSAVFFMDPTSSLVEGDFPSSLVIHGPGEYEVGEFVIHGEADDKGTFYIIESGGERLLLVNSSDVSSLSSDMRFGTVVVRLDEIFDEANTASLPGELIVLYGPSEFTSTLKATGMDKIGKRKKAELSGQTILLTK